MGGATWHRLTAAARETLRVAAHELSEQRAEPPAATLAPDPESEGRLGRGRFTVGRGPGCDHRLDEQTVSRHHAELRWVDERWVLTDLRSTNGSYVNGRRVWRIVLEPGDEVTLGAARVQFRPRAAAPEHQPTAALS